MSAPAAISGEFTTIKHVPSRKVYQLVIEVAEEAAQHAFDTLGLPGHGGHIALARLAKPPQTEPPRERTPFTDLPYAQQAAMRCNEHGFWSFIRARGGRCEGPEDAVRFVRLHCGVSSRKDIAKGTTAGARWEGLEGEYFAHSRGMR